MTAFGVAATPAEAEALLVAGPDGRQRWTQGQLWSAVGAYAALLEDRTRPGEVVLIVSRTRLEAMAMFLAALVAGRLPAFLPPRHPRQDAGHFARQQAAAIGRIEPGLTVVTEPATREGLLATSPELAPGLLLAPPATTTGAWEPAREALVARIAGRRHRDLPLFLQHSSGTTGLKKACAVGAEALGAQYDCYWRRVVRARLAPEPRVASWLPLYHDMGLVAAFLLPLLDGAPVACLDAFDWVTRPQLLPDLIEAERATLCWMPNFAFRHLVRLRRFLEARDLSPVRAWINASETCRGQDAQDFEAAFAGWGVRPGAVLASYAMAETVFAVTQSLPGRRLSLAAPQALRPGDRLAKERLLDGPMTEAAWPGARLIQSSGTPVPGTHLAAYHAGQRLPEGCYGELGLRSRCFVGHGGPGAAQPGLLPDGTFLTGDLGVVMAGEAFVFGRVKEVIIVAGRNLHAGDIEAAAGDVPGAKPGRVVAFGLDNPATGTEDLVIVAERDPRPGIAPEALRAAIVECVSARFLAAPREVLVVEERWLVKSTSGKISREANRRKYQAGEDQAGKDQAGAGPAERGAA